MQNHMFDSLVNNAIDFMQVALEELEDRPKYSVIHFCSSVEIFFKARLVLEHWSLVAIRPERATLTGFHTGKETTVNLDGAISRLKNVAGEDFSKDTTDTFDGLREHRNKLMHFFHDSYAATSKGGENIEQVVMEQCRAWLYLYRLLTSQWKNHFSGFTREIERLHKLMLGNRKFLRTRYDSIKKDLPTLMEKGGKDSNVFQLRISRRQADSTHPTARRARVPGLRSPRALSTH